jgi:hypothetical protein
MINFELDGSRESVSIFVDNDGVEELINYLQYIKAKDDHMHLVVGNELTEEILEIGNSLIKQVKIVFLKD